MTGIMSHLYKDEIKEYIKTFKFSEQWFGIVMLIIALSCLALTILLIEYNP